MRPGYYGFASGIVICLLCEGLLWLTLLTVPSSSGDVAFVIRVAYVFTGVLSFWGGYTAAHLVWYFDEVARVSRIAEHFGDRLAAPQKAQDPLPNSTYDASGHAM